MDCIIFNLSLRDFEMNNHIELWRLSSDTKEAPIKSFQLIENSVMFLHSIFNLSSIFSSFPHTRVNLANELFDFFLIHFHRYLNVAAYQFLRDIVLSSVLVAVD